MYFSQILLKNWHILHFLPTNQIRKVVSISHCKIALRLKSKGFVRFSVWTQKKRGRSPTNFPKNRPPQKKGVGGPHFSLKGRKGIFYFFTKNGKITRKSLTFSELQIAKKCLKMPLFSHFYLFFALFSDFQAPEKSGNLCYFCHFTVICL